MTDFILIVIGLTFIGVGINVFMLNRRINTLDAQLWQVRIATVELINYMQDDIHDLQESLVDASIPLSRNHMHARLRQRTEEHYDESLARWQETVNKAEKFWENPNG